MDGIDQPRPFRRPRSAWATRLRRIISSDVDTVQFSSSVAIWSVGVVSVPVHKAFPSRAVNTSTFPRPTICGARSAPGAPPRAAEQDGPAPRRDDRAAAGRDGGAAADLPRRLVHRGGLRDDRGGPEGRRGLAAAAGRGAPIAPVRLTPRRLHPSTHAVRMAFPALTLLLRNWGRLGNIFASVVSFLAPPSVHSASL